MRCALFLAFDLAFLLPALLVFGAHWAARLAHLRRAALFFERLDFALCRRHARGLERLSEMEARSRSRRAARLYGARLARWE